MKLDRRALITPFERDQRTGVEGRARSLRRVGLAEDPAVPAGQIVELVPLDEVLLNGGDHLDEEERAALHESIKEGLEDMKAGRTFDADEVMTELRSRPWESDSRHELVARRSASTPGGSKRAAARWRSL